MYLWSVIAKLDVDLHIVVNSGYCFVMNMV